MFFNNTNIILIITKTNDYTSNFSIKFVDNTNNWIIDSLLEDIKNNSLIKVPLGFLFVGSSMDKKMYINNRKISNDFLLENLKDIEELKQLLLYIKNNF